MTSSLFLLQLCWLGMVVGLKEPQVVNHMACDEPIGCQNSHLKQLLEKARSTKSVSFLLLKNQQLLVDLNPESEPLETHSITKSIVSLGIGILIDQGKIDSVDQPVSDWYPEWRHGLKQQITLRNLLTHTSGLDAKSSGAEVYQHTDCIEFALTADLVSTPGEAFFYNNKAVNLLSGIIEKVTGKRADLWIQEQLFAPLDIEEASWSLDPSGHAYAHAGLKMRAKELAKIGQLIANQGKWNGRRLISKEWLAMAMQPQPSQGSCGGSCGFLWWIWDDPTPLYAAIGYGGQYLIVIPGSSIVVVRQTQGTDASSSFDELPELLIEVTKKEQNVRSLSES